MAGKSNVILPRTRDKAAAEAAPWCQVRTIYSPNGMCHDVHKDQRDENRHSERALDNKKQFSRTRSACRGWRGREVQLGQGSNCSND